MWWWVGGGTKGGPPQEGGVTPGGPGHQHLRDRIPPALGPQTPRGDVRRLSPWSWESVGARPRPLGPPPRSLTKPHRPGAQHTHPTHALCWLHHLSGQTSCAHTPWTEARPCLEASLQRADGRRMEVTGDRGLGRAPGLSSDTPSSLWMKEQNCSHLDRSKGPAVPMLTHTRTCRPELTRCPLEHAPPPPPAALCRPWSPHTE